MLKPAGFVGAAGLLAGVTLGVSGRVSDYLGPEAALVFALGAPWFIVAFGVGAVVRRPLAGAIGGALALAVSVVVYYGLMLTVERRGGPGYAASMAVLWGTAAAFCGLLFGAAGAVGSGGRDEQRGAAMAVLGGALAGEALLFIARGGTGPGGWVLACELVVGVAIVLTASRMRRPLPVAVGTTAVAFSASAECALRLLMRARGWGG